ncbi:hypothetical protein CerSpe_071540 [Prunus speciosa]
MIEDGLAKRRPEAPRYTKPYPPEIDRTPLPRNYRLPEFMLFSPGWADLLHRTHRPFYGLMWRGRLGCPKAPIICSLLDQCGILTDSPAEVENGEIEVSSAEVSIDKPFICKELVKADYSRTKIPDATFAARETKAYTFNLTRAEAIFDQLLIEKKVKLSFDHKISKAEELNGKTFCKYHSSWSHSTNNCIVLRDVIQKLVDEKKL